jgi:hypothetical protein
MTTRKTLSLYLSLVLSASLFNAFAPVHPRTGPVACDLGSFVNGVRDSIDGIREGISGVVKFVESVTGLVKTIASLAGIEAVLLLLGVAAISSIIGLVGVPRGKTSFLVSLGCADALWVTWHASFGPLDAGFITSVVKTNLILLAPLGVIALAARYGPSLGRHAAGAFRRVFPSRGGYERDELVEIFERYRDLHSGLEKALLRDIIRAGDGKAGLSSGTRLLAGEVARLSRELENAGGGKKDGG